MVASWMSNSQSKNYGTLWRGNGFKMQKKRELQLKLPYVYFLFFAVPTLIPYPPDHTAKKG